MPSYPSEDFEAQQERAFDEPAVTRRVRIGVPAEAFNPRVAAFIAAQRAEAASRDEVDGARTLALTFGLIYVGDELAKIRELLEKEGGSDGGTGD